MYQQLDNCPTRFCTIIINVVNMLQMFGKNQDGSAEPSDTKDDK